MASSDKDTTGSHDTTEELIHFKCINYMYTCGMKLQMKPVVLATSATVYHKFFEQARLQDYDPYLIATTSLYLSGKVEEEHVKLRDVINVAHRTLHPDEPQLDVGDTYYAIRDSLVNCELLIMRMLQFCVTYDHPHKYLLCYLSSLREWIGPEKFDQVGVARTAWSLLNDSYHCAVLCLRWCCVQPQHVAVAVCLLALHCCDLRVPHEERAEVNWYMAMYEDLVPSKVEEILCRMMDLYDIDTEHHDGTMLATGRDSAAMA